MDRRAMIRGLFILGVGSGAAVVQVKATQPPVIEGKDFKGQLIIKGDGLTVQNCVFQGTEIAMQPEDTYVSDTHN